MLGKFLDFFVCSVLDRMRNEDPLRLKAKSFALLLSGFVEDRTGHEHSGYAASFKVN